MKKFFSILTVLLFLVGCISVITHDEKKAAVAAEEFARIALVKQNLSEAYDLLSPVGKPTFGQFQDVLTKMHPSAFPLTLRATEFEPIPGQNGINIFLLGEHGSEIFYYRLLMAGTAALGYKVSGIWRGNGPYPASKLRQELKK